jgi:hypothetical protein
MTIDDKGYSTAQVQALIDNAKAILRIVGMSNEDGAEVVYDALEDFCWHVPGCEAGDHRVHPRADRTAHRRDRPRGAGGAR